MKCHGRIRYNTLRLKEARNYLLTITLIITIGSSTLPLTNGFIPHYPSTIQTPYLPQRSTRLSKTASLDDSSSKPPSPTTPTSGNNFLPTSNDPVLRNDLTCQFSRWTFLQSILSDELSYPQDVNLLLYQILKSFVDFPRPRELQDGKSNPSPELTDEQTVLLCEKLLVDVDADGRGVIRVLPETKGASDEEYNDPALVKTFELLERLQPDQEEDEEAYQCCWDVVMNLYGEQSTRIEMEGEGKPTRSWTVRSGVVRLMLHYEFLYGGVGKVAEDE